MSSSIDYWSHDHIHEYLEAGDPPSYFSGKNGIEWSEIFEADAKAGMLGLIAGGAAGGSVGGSLTIGTLTIPGAAVGAAGGIVAGAGVNSLWEYSEQDAVLDYIRDNENSENFGGGDSCTPPFL
jgi:hypothetical protein